MKKYKSKSLHLSAFLISFLVMILVFLINRMNGKDFLVIRSDLLESVGVYKELIRNLFSKDSIFFSFSSGLGLDNMMVVSGLFNPFNLFYLVLNKFNVNFVTAVVIIFKVAFSALSFSIFSEHTLKNKSFFSVIISVFYSLNAYSLEYGSIQIGWLDGLIVLPLLCASIVELIENNKRISLIILYTYIFLSQYYIGFMIGIFTFLFVVLYLLILYQYKSDNKIKEFFSVFINWGLGVVISILLSAFVWVPTLFFLASNRVPDSTEVIQINTSLYQIFNSLFWGMDYGIEGKYSYIYCGIPVLILSVLFFLNNKINIKTKIFSAIIISVLFLSMVSNRLNLIWHVFDQPDDFWYRYAFLCCFALCSIASFEVAQFELKKGSILLYIVLVISCFYQFMLHTSSLWSLEQGVLNTNYGFIINLILLVAWSFILYFVFCKKKILVICYVFAFITMAFELLFGSKRQMTNLIDAKSFYSWTNSVENVVEVIKNNDKGFYRSIISNNDIGYNSDTYFGFYGIGDFGNQEKYSVRNFLSNIGFATSPRVTCENGYTPVSEMILGIKYEINAPYSEIELGSDDLQNAEDKTSIELKNDESQELNSSYNINPFSLNLGYLVDGDILFYEYSGRNVFENMNQIVSSMSGLDDACFIQVAPEKIKYESDSMELVEMDTGELVFGRNEYVGEMTISVPNDGYESAYIQFEKDETGIYGIDYYVLDAKNAPNAVVNRLGVSSAIKMNTSETDENYLTTICSHSDYSPEFFSCDNINVYYLNEENLKKQYGELSKNQFQVTKYNNGHVEGTIDVKGNKRMLFTSIPYDPGWKAYVNGAEVETIRVIDGAFMAIYLPNEGEYNVVFDFECPGLKIGSIISICGILAFLSVIFEKNLKTNRNEEKKNA